MSRYGIGYIVGTAPFLKAFVLIDLEKAREAIFDASFVLNADMLRSWRKLEVDWTIAPDRILRAFNKPIRKPKQGSSSNVSA